MNRSANPFEHYATPQQLKDHVRSFHRTNPVSDYLQEIVYGGSDGIVTTLAVISGFAGAGAGNLQLTTMVVLLFAVANLFGDATSMGLGNFLSVRSEKAVWNRQASRQQQQLRSNRQKALKSTEFLLTKKGYSQSDARELAGIIASNPEHWLQFTLEEELGISSSFKENPAISSMFTFFAFIVFGFFPVIPFLFSGFDYQFQLSVVLAAISLSLLGSVRKIISQETWLRSIGETLLVGGLSGAIAFGVGMWFGG